MFSLMCARINDWVNNGEAGDLRRNRAHYDVIVMREQLMLGFKTLQLSVILVIHFYFWRVMDFYVHKIHSIKYVHGLVMWCFVLLWLCYERIHVLHLPILFSVVSWALGQWYNCPSVSEATLNDIEDINYYPMLRADSRFWLVNNREIWSRISRLTSSAWDINTKERHWWRHNGDSDRRPLSLPLRYDLVTRWFRPD